MTTTNQFWRSKHLLEMSHDEWESVCDGCAKCCLHQLEDEETEEIVFTNVACELLDEGSCRCTDYQQRSARVPDCMAMNKENVVECAEFAPPSCAYRLLLEGKELPSWHHLNSGSKRTIHELNKTVQGRTVKLKDVLPGQLENHVVYWPNDK
jgi:uncharacterized cysteine cluster protein YcgN (CxxCxxCC family)